MNISLIGSGRCNLKCSYCFLCKNKANIELDKLLIEYLQNGKYLSNYLNFFERISSIKSDQPPFNYTSYDVDKISFWGGEPTLNLSIWTEVLSQWLEYFPNVNDITFVTNGLFQTDELISFIEAYQLFAKSKCLTLNLQVSLDGPVITEKYRGVSTEKIIQNLKQLIETLSNFNLKTYINISFKATTGIDELNKIHQTVESATSYYQWWAQQISELIHLNKNKYINIVNIPELTYAFISDYTQQQGLDYAHSLKVFRAIDWQQFDIYDLPFNIYESCDLTHYVDMYYDRYDYNSTYYCGQYIHDIMMRPDGIVIGCLAGLYNDMPSYEQDLVKENNQEELQVNQSIHPSFYLDINKMSDQQILDFYTRMNNLQQCQKTVVAYGSALINELAKIRQVDRMYLDHIKAVEAARSLMSRSMCWFNNMRKTGTFYYTLPGLYRLYLNGFLEEAKK